VPDHISAGTTTTEDGRRMSINVEMIGTGLVVQHYVADEATPSYVRMISISDVFTANGRTQVNVLWELLAGDAGNGRTRYTNHVTARPTDAFMAFLAEHGVAFEDAAAARQSADSDHNRRETPFFAESIARRAIARAKGGCTVREASARFTPAARTRTSRSCGWNTGIAP
jgi:hypothetical protein